MSVGLVAPAASATTLPAEAVAAVDRAVSSGTKWYHGIVTALGAVDGEHLSRAVLVHSSRSLF